MSCDEGLYFDDILAACELVNKFTKGMSYDNFTQDDRTYHATLRNLEIIGEAIKNISNETKTKYPQVNGARSPDFGILWHMIILGSVMKSFGMPFKMRFPC